MTSKAVSLPRYVARAGAVLVVALGASACSSVPDWVDPTTWIGGSDQTGDQGTDQTADNGQTPDLSTIPDKPQTPSTADEQKNVADSLAADRAKTQYSADALRGGTEAAAAPPPAAPAPATEDLASNSESAPPPPPAPTGPTGPAPAPGALPAQTDTTQAAAPAPAPATNTQVAAAEMPPPAAAAVPAVPAVPSAVQAQISPTDASLGFRPSSAPPLDASVAQFVPKPILSRYQQTASIGPQPAVPSSTMAPDGSETAMNMPSSHRRGHRAMAGVGGPEAMSGAVVANFDALQAGAAAPVAGIPGGPSAVVFFKHDTTVLDAAARAQVRDAAKAFLARGGQGYVKIVGHASSRAGKMSSERQLVWNFERSQARANAVARALIREGVPADRVLVDAVGDDQSGYQLTAPDGGDAGRRADIFFQG